MRLAVLCATRRGYRFLARLAELAPDAELLVFSFPEDSWEPPFVDDIRRLTEKCGGRFIPTRRVDEPVPVAALSAGPVDLAFAVNWRYRIPPAIYCLPRLGTYVFHDSLLPRYRGFSPTVWAIANGEDHTGVTLFEIAEEIDAGPVVDQLRVPIGPTDAIGEVSERVTEAYLTLLVRNWDGLASGRAVASPQDHSCASFTCKRLPEDNSIDWRAPTERIHNLVRAVSAPYPGAFCRLGDQKLIVWAAGPEATRPWVGAVPGRVVQVRPGRGSVVLTGDGALLVERVELDDGPVPAAEVLNSLSQTLT